MWIEWEGAYFNSISGGRLKETPYIQGTDALELSLGEMLMKKDNSNENLTKRRAVRHLAHQRHLPLYMGADA